MHSEVVFRCEGHIGIICLARTSALNALNLSMIQAIYQTLLSWQADDAIHAIVIEAVPGKAFCAGGDIRALSDATFEEQMQFFQEEYRLNYLIHCLSKPYIALMDGITMGGGVGIGLHGSHPIASERFIFAMPETGIGFFPDIGASYLLARCPNAFGYYIGLTGAKLRATEASSLGLVKHVVSAEQMPFIIDALVNMDLSAEANYRVDRLLDSFKMAPSIPPSSDLKTWVNASFKQPTMPLIMESLKQGATAWHQETHRILLQKSPLSLCVTLLQLHKARQLSFAECLQLDYVLASHFMQDNDFYEGVRALLTDKDKSPQWTPFSIDVVHAGLVEAYFQAMLMPLSLSVVQ